eukprot:CAMPEP_0119014186 /NCGR_PEP_ID=MMETSP1176-20130426/9403_1 /TAXON_ID=265551 /ORGANISM="Synedropsis recta cf, Strain CCMP1620" /LENGTH=485 /DNA_ID=CAMNT_0006967335 /DNA_START=52 /DNA_END=1509 /DNA_ORIENTATION=+
MSDKLHHRGSAGGQTPGASPSQSSYSKTAKRTMKKSSLGCWCLAVGLLVLGGGSFAQLSKKGHKKINSDVDISKICINDPNHLPEYWRPPKNMRFEDSGLPWSQEEQAMADEAVQTGLDELLNFYEKNMTKIRIKKVGVDAVNSLIDEAYASGNNPAYHQRAVVAATKHLLLVAGQYVDEENEKKYRGCVHTYDRLKYLGYAQYLINNLPQDEELRDFQKKLVLSVNQMFVDCTTLENVLDVGDLKAIFLKKNEHADPVFEWVLQAIALTDCLTVPDLNMPEGTEEFVANVWHYLDSYELFYARDQPKHYRDYETRNQAWLATHIAYIPTGYGRHVQRIEDAPYLYKYIRENYYYALEYGMLDLMCEFVDLIRQYGCTEENDYQLRHGTRFILSLYEKAGHSWMNYKEHNEKDGDVISDYTMIHKPWTAISGVIQREFEPIVPGSYGFAFERALENVAARSGTKKTTRKTKKHKAGVQNHVRQGS